MLKLMTHPPLILLQCNTGGHRRLPSWHGGGIGSGMRLPMAIGMGFGGVAD
jgi:hypothetical protein